MADIGQWQNPQFYIDLKIYDDEGNFLGVFGVGKSLDAFTDIFNEYKKTYGYDFIFDSGGAKKRNTTILVIMFSRRNKILHYFEYVFQEGMKQNAIRQCP